MADPEEETPFDANDDTEEEDDAEEGELPEVVDLSDVQAASYDVIPRGMYDGYIDSIDYGLSQSSNQPMLTVICKFDYAPDGEEARERTLRYYMTLGGDGAGRTKATLARLDPELDLSHIVPAELDEAFSGMEVKLKVTVRPDREDKKIKRNNIADIYPIDDEEE